jgi:GTP cyclohydrolase I
MELEIDDGLFNEEELKNTSKRYAKFLEEWKNKCKDFNFTVFDNPGFKGMVIMKNISFNSLCAHHLLPFRGVGHIAYIPGKKICGASKLIRTLEKYASKPQTQEKLAVEVIDFLQKELKPVGVAVVLIAKHDCMCIRGVKNATSEMVTSELRGQFFSDMNTRSEFMQFIRG